MCHALLTAKLPAQRRDALVGKARSACRYIIANAQHRVGPGVDPYRSWSTGHADIHHPHLALSEPGERHRGFLADFHRRHDTAPALVKEERKACRIVRREWQLADDEIDHVRVEDTAAKLLMDVDDRVTRRAPESDRSFGRAPLELEQHSARRLMRAVGDRAESVQLVDCGIHYLTADVGEALRNFNQMWSGSIDYGSGDDGAGTGAAVFSVACDPSLKDYRI